MPELILLVIIVAGLLKYNSAVRNTAKAAEYTSRAWSEDVKAGAIKKIAQIEITEEEVTKANTVLESINKVNLR